jgi:hypothetical protein
VFGASNHEQETLGATGSNRKQYEVVAVYTPTTNLGVLGLLVHHHLPFAPLNRLLRHLTDTFGAKVEVEVEVEVEVGAVVRVELDWNWEGSCFLL